VNGENNRLGPTFWSVLNADPPNLV